MEWKPPTSCTQIIFAGDTTVNPLLAVGEPAEIYSQIEACVMARKPLHGVGAPDGQEFILTPLVLERVVALLHMRKSENRPQIVTANAQGVAYGAV